MFVIMVKEDLQTQNFKVFPVVENISITKLFLLDEHFTNLNNKCSKLLAELSRRISFSHNNTNLDIFKWDEKNFKLKSFEFLNEKFNEDLEKFYKKFDEIKNNEERMSVKSDNKNIPFNLNEKSLPVLSNQVNISSKFNDENKSVNLNEKDISIKTTAKSIPVKTNKEKYNIKEDTKFLSCFYCYIKKTDDKNFKKIVNVNSIQIVETCPDSKIYKVYCLKKDFSILFKLISEKYICKLNLENIFDKQKAQQKTQEVHLNMVNLYKKVANLEIHIILIRAYLEALHSIGLPPNYKFKFVENFKPEIKSIKHANKVRNGEESYITLEFWIDI